MRDHVGRHDGQVQGHRYFQCKGIQLFLMICLDKNVYL